MKNSVSFRNGFTLIELVVVLVLLAFLSAVALPYYSNLREDAALSQAKSIAGSLEAGAKIVKSVFNSKGFDTRTQNLQGFGDGTIDTNNLGFPIGTSKGNANENVGIGNAGCADLWRGVMADPPSVSHNNDTQDYRSYRHTGNRVCSYVYRANGDNGNRNTGQIVIRYDSRDGSVDLCGQHPELSAC